MTSDGFAPKKHGTGKVALFRPLRRLAGPKGVGPWVRRRFYVGGHFGAGRTGYGNLPGLGRDCGRRGTRESWQSDHHL